MKYSGALFLLLANCCGQPAPLYPPGPSATADQILSHGSPGLAAAHRQDRLEAVMAVRPTGDEVADRLAWRAAEAAADELWAPVWQALSELRTARAKGTEADIAKALCRLQQAVPARWREALLPAIDGCSR